MSETISFRRVIDDYFDYCFPAVGYSVGYSYTNLDNMGFMSFNGVGIKFAETSFEMGSNYVKPSSNNIKEIFDKTYPDGTFKKLCTTFPVPNVYSDKKGLVKLLMPEPMEVRRLLKKYLEFEYELKKNMNLLAQQIELSDMNCTCQIQNGDLRFYDHIKSEEKHKEEWDLFSSILKSYMQSDDRGGYNIVFETLDTVRVKGDTFGIDQVGEILKKLRK